MEEVDAEESQNTIVVDLRSLLSEEDEETTHYLLASRGGKNEEKQKAAKKAAGKAGKAKPKAKEHSPKLTVKIPFRTPDKASRAQRGRSATPTELPSPVPGTFHCKGTIQNN